MASITNLNSDTSQKEAIFKTGIDIDKLEEKRLYLLLEEAMKNKIKQSNSKKWITQAEQLKKKNVSELLDKHSDTINNLQVTNIKLNQHLEFENYLRDHLYADIANIKKTFELFRECYDHLKLSFHQTLQYKEKVSTESENLLKELGIYQNETDAKILNYKMYFNNMHHMLKSEKQNVKALEQKTASITSEQERKIQMLEEDKTKLLILIDELEKKNIDTVTELNNNIKEKENILSEFMLYKKDQNSLASEHDEKLNNYSKENQELHAMNGEMMNCVEKLKKKCEHLHTIVTEQTDVMQHMEMRNMELEGVIMDMELYQKNNESAIVELGLQLQADYEEMKHKISSMENSYKELEDNASALEHTHLDLKEQYDTAKDIIADLNIKLKVQEDEANIFENTIKHLQEQIEFTKINQEDQVNALKNTVYLITQSRDEAVKSRNECNNNNERMQEEIYEKNEEIEMLTDKVEKLKTNERRIIIAMQRRIDDLSKEKDKLKVNLKNSEDKYKKYKKFHEEKITELNVVTENAKNEFNTQLELSKKTNEETWIESNKKHQEEIVKLTNIIQEKDLKIADLKYCKQCLESQLNSSEKESDPKTLQQLKSPSKRVSFSHNLPPAWDASWSESSLESGSGVVNRFMIGSPFTKYFQSKKRKAANDEETCVMVVPPCSKNQKKDTQNNI